MRLKPARWRPRTARCCSVSAEVHALLGNAPAALTDLTAAIAHGYSRQDVRENDEFAPLRNLRAFADILAASPAPAR